MLAALASGAAALATQVACRRRPVWAFWAVSLAGLFFALTAGLLLVEGVAFLAGADPSLLPERLLRSLMALANMYCIMLDSAYLAPWLVALAIAPVVAYQWIRGGRCRPRSEGADPSAHDGTGSSA